MPCALLVNGPKFWPQLKQVYAGLYKDVLIGVRKSLSAGLLETAKLMDL